MTLQHGKTRDMLGDLRGMVFEEYYFDHLPSILGRRMSRAKANMPLVLLDVIEPRLSADATDDILLADIVVSGHMRARPEVGEVWLVVDVSAAVDRTDVDRAVRRAAVLRSAGLVAIPAVAGKDATPSGRQAVDDACVVAVFGGRVEGWDEAIERYVSGGVPVTTP